MKLQYSQFHSQFDYNQRSVRMEIICGRKERLESGQNRENEAKTKERRENKSAVIYEPRDNAPRNLVNSFLSYWNADFQCCEAQLVQSACARPSDHVFKFKTSRKSAKRPDRTQGIPFDSTREFAPLIARPDSFCCFLSTIQKG